MGIKGDLNHCFCFSSFDYFRRVSLDWKNGMVTVYTDCTPLTCSILLRVRVIDYARRILACRI